MASDDPRPLTETEALKAMRLLNRSSWETYTCNDCGFPLGGSLIGPERPVMDLPPCDICIRCKSRNIRTEKSNE